MRSFVLNSSFLVGLASLISRVLGFVRDLLMAALLGSGPVADAFFMAFRLPHLVRRVVSEGGVHAGFVPVYMQIATTEGDKAAHAFTNIALINFGLLLLAISGMMHVMAGFAVLGLASGLDQGTQEQATWLMRLAFPSIFGLSLSAMIGAALAARGYHKLSAFSALEINLLLILMLLLLLYGPDMSLDHKASWLAGTITFAGLFQLITLVLASRAAHLGLRFVRPRWTPSMKKLWAMAGPALVISGAAQLMLLAALHAASFRVSAVSWLTYAERIFQLPLGMVSTVMGIVVLPGLARAFSQRDEAVLITLQNRALDYGLMLTLPAAIGMYWLAEPIVHFLFERGAFDSIDRQKTADILRGLSFGLPFAMIGKVASPSYFARSIYRFPLLCAVFGLGVTWIACYVLLRVHGAFGLGLGVSTGLFIHAILLMSGLWWAGFWTIDRLIGLKMLRIPASCFLMILALFGLEYHMNPLHSFAILMVFIGAGICIYGGACGLFEIFFKSKMALES
jgi:putative peptidoglycan lipid II flippase